MVPAGSECWQVVTSCCGTVLASYLTREAALEWAAWQASASGGGWVAAHDANGRLVETKYLPLKLEDPEGCEHAGRRGVTPASDMGPSLT